jgi:hypothetical protein
VRTRLDEIVIDCSDPARLVRFWAALLGGEPVDRAPSWSYVDPPSTPRLAFQSVPEPRTTKNRLHLDLVVPAIGPAADEAVALGATRSGDVVTDAQGCFQVMLDPEGNEFCFVD